MTPILCRLSSERLFCGRIDGWSIMEPSGARGGGMMRDPSRHLKGEEAVKPILWIGIGGFCGAIARFLIGSWLSGTVGASAFPVATFVHQHHRLFPPGVAGRRRLFAHAAGHVRLDRRLPGLFYHLFNLQRGDPPPDRTESASCRLFSMRRAAWRRV